MALRLSAQNKADIWAESNVICPPQFSEDGTELKFTMPEKLGAGYHRKIKLCPGMELNIFHKTYRDIVVDMPENHHPVQFEIFLSGVVDSGEFLYQSAQQGYVGGSGIQPEFRSLYSSDQVITGVDIHLQPQRLCELFTTPEGIPPLIQDLIQPGKRQNVFSPTITADMKTVVRQIINCSLAGVVKQFYLQGKALELIALQLDGIARQKKSNLSSRSLKPDTLARVQTAADKLRFHIESPPTQRMLAQQVGISDRTLLKGFKALFGVTPFVYLTQHRMTAAKCLLCDSNHTIIEIANQVGYTNPAQFAAAFKRHFGMTPSLFRQR